MTVSALHVFGFLHNTHVITLFLTESSLQNSNSRMHSVNALSIQFGNPATRISPVTQHQPRLPFEHSFSFTDKLDTSSTRLSSPDGNLTQTSLTGHSPGSQRARATCTHLHTQLLHPPPAAQPPTPTFNPPRTLLPYI